MASTADISISQKRQTSAAGVGLQGMADWSTQFPFLDTMKLSREWYDWDRQTAEGITLDKHGWVTALEKGLRPQTVFLTNNEGTPVIYKRYIVRWQGKGKLSYGGCAKKVGRAHGGDRISITYGSCFLALESVNKEDPIRNITIVPEKHIKAFDNGEIFNPDFIERIKGFRALRFMDWMNTNGSEQKLWSDRPLPEDRTFAKKGVPLEYMIALVNKVLADPWFNMPHQSDLNYMRQFAQLVKTSLNPELNVYVEHSNEVWNWIFPQTIFAFDSAKEKFNKEEDAFFEWHGMRTAQMCDIWKKGVYGERKNSVVCVLGTQASWPGLEVAALECPSWVKQGNKPCVEHGIDAVAITGYFSGCLDGGESKVNRQKIIGWSHHKDKGLSKAYEQALDGRHFECEDTIPGVLEYYKYHVAEAKKRGLSVVAYEGGQHITSNFSETQNDERFSNLHLSLNRHPYMKELYKKNFENWKSAGGTLFMHFVDAASFSQYGSWGALEYITQETSPKWEALMEFNNTPCWWENCKQ